LVAVSAPGYVYTSNDSGEIWTPQTSAGLRNWSAVASSEDGLKVIAGDRYGYIFTSNNGGMTWTQQSNVTNVTWYKFVCDINCSNIAGSSADGIYSSNDSGVTWTKRYSSTWVYHALTCDRSTCTKVLALSFTTVLRSTDGGQSWTTTPAPGGLYYWNDAASSSDGSTVVIISSGYNGGGYDYTGSVYRSTDAGASFITIIAGTQNQNNYRIGYFSLATSNDGAKWVMTSDVPTTVLTSSNGGSSFSTQNGFTSMNGYYASYLACDSNCTKVVLAVTGTYIYKSNNSGVTWSVAI
jgi:photosystem II stability/assembly factor-like uncharacterized protein